MAITMADHPMTLCCECCKGRGYLTIIDAAHDDQIIKQPCGACAATGAQKLTSSEAETFKKFLDYYRQFND